MAFSIPPRWTCRIGLALSALIVQSAAVRAQQAHNVAEYICQPKFYDFMLMSRSAVFGPLLHQAYNGQVLEQTLWNYHYGEGKDDLLTNGHYLLDRLARRSGYGEILELHLQTARDLAYSREHRDRYQKFRGDLNFKRVEAIVDYMRANHPEVTFTVRITDPTPLGMNGMEAARPLREITTTSRGVLPPELLQGLGSYLRTTGTGDTGVEPPTASAPGTSTSSGAFGAEATQSEKKGSSPDQGAPPPAP
jgi:hypothetical protein